MARRRQSLTLAEANATLHGDDLYSFLYRRAQVVDYLSRDEPPPRGWDKEFPDLAVERQLRVNGEPTTAGAEG